MCEHTEGSMVEALALRSRFLRGLAGAASAAPAKARGTNNRPGRKSRRSAARPGKSQGRAKQ